MKEGGERAGGAGENKQLGVSLLTHRRTMEYFQFHGVKEMPLFSRRTVVCTPIYVDGPC